MAKTTRKIFLRNSTSDDLKSVLKLIDLASADSQKAQEYLAKVVKTLNSAIVLATSKPTPGTRPLPAPLQKRLISLRDRVQRLEIEVKDWAVTKEEKILKRDRLNHKRAQKGGKT